MVKISFQACHFKFRYTKIRESKVFCFFGGFFFCCEQDILEIKIWSYWCMIWLSKFWFCVCQIVWLNELNYILKERQLVSFVSNAIMVNRAFRMLKWKSLYTCSYKTARAELCPWFPIPTYLIFKTISI